MSDAEGQCREFFDVIRKQCNDSEADRMRRIQTSSSSSSSLSSSESNNRQMIAFDDNDIPAVAMTTTNCVKVPGNNGNGSRFLNRIVPRMGTKVDSVHRHVTSPLVTNPYRLPWQISPSAETDERCNESRDAFPWRSKSISVSNTNCDVKLKSIVLPLLSPSNHQDWKAALSNQMWNNENIENSLPSSSDEHSPAEEERWKKDGSGEERRKEVIKLIHKQFADVMYTNEANLQHTIDLQQKLFEQQLQQNNNDNKQQQQQQQMEEKKRMMMINCGAENDELISCSDDRKNEEKLEWVIKKRLDGTRYITRRPIRKDVPLKRDGIEEEKRRRCRGSTAAAESIRNGGGKKNGIRSNQGQKNRRENKITFVDHSEKDTSSPPTHLNTKDRNKWKKVKDGRELFNHKVLTSDFLESVENHHQGQMEGQGQGQGQGRSSSEHQHHSVLSVITI